MGRVEISCASRVAKARTYAIYSGSLPRQKNALRIAATLAFPKQGSVEYNGQALRANRDALGIQSQPHL